MKKSKLIATAMLASTLVLAGCDNGKKECNHVDEKAPWHICDLCGEKCSEHSFGEWSQKSPADFEHKKVEHRICSICGEEETREVGEVVPHHYSDDWSHDENKHWHACTDEGYENLKKDEAAHSFGEWSQKSPADFEHKEVQHRFCSECDYEETKEVGEVVPHHYSDDWSYDENKHWHACDDEGYEDLKKDEATHSFGEWSQKSPADFEHKEVQHRFCSACDYEETKEVGEVVPHNFSEDWSMDAEKHWHACTDEGYEDLKDGEEEHYDLDGDFKCDVCEREFDEIESISIVSPVTYMGRGEIIELSSSVIAHGEATTDVEFTMPDSTVFTLLDNEDGTAYLSTTSATVEETSEKSTTITLTSKYDETKTATLKIFASTYGETKRNSITGFFGVDDFQFIPYFIGTTFTKSGSVLNQVSSNVNSHVTFKKVLGAFKNQGTWTVVSESETEALISIANPNDEFTHFEGVITKTSETATKVVYSKELTKLSQFPTKAVNEFISGKTTSSFVAPIDGDEFTFSKSSTSATITSNGSLESYKNKLAESGYYVVDNSNGCCCVSSERTLVISLNSIAAGGFRITVSTQGLPTQTDWTDNDKQKMMDLIGEVIPFIPNDYKSWTTYETEMNTYSSREESEAIAIAELDKASGYVKTIESGYVSYSKDIDEISSYKIIVEGVSLYIYKVAKIVDTWYPAKVAAALGVEESAIVKPEGTSYSYQLTDGAATIEVAGDLAAYKTALSDAGYLLFDKTSGFSSKSYAVNADRTILIQFTQDDGFFTLDFTKQEEPKGDDWSEADLNLMNTYFGGRVPFVKDGYGEWYYYEAGDYIYAQSYRTEAQAVAKATFDADGSYGEATLSSGSYIYKKAIAGDKYHNLVITILSNGQIQVSKEAVYLSTWEADDIAAALGSDAKETLPSAEADGNTFQYTFGENEVTIGVMNSSASTMLAYRDVLDADGSKFHLVGTATTSSATYESESNTVTIVVKKISAKKFEIYAKGHLPEGQYHELPVNEIAKQLNNDAGLGDLALPEGTLFFYEAKEKYQCDVTVLEGGSMSNYISALGEKGFVLKDDAYEKEGNNIRIVLSAGEGDVYSAHLSLIEEPVITGWSEEIKEVIANLFDYCWVEATADDLPYPSDAVSVEKVTEKSFKVTGMDMVAYKSQLIEAGFSVADYYDWYGEYDVSVKGSYYCFYIMEQSDGSVMFTYTYY